MPSLEVEHSFGILKEMFPALLYGLRKHKALNSLSTIFAAVVLYNLARHFNEPDPILPEDLSNDEFDRLMQLTDVNRACRRPRNEHKIVRDQIIRNYFS